MVLYLIIMYIVVCIVCAIFDNNTTFTTALSIGSLLLGCVIYPFAIVTMVAISTSIRISLSAILVICKK